MSAPVAAPLAPVRAPVKRYTRWHHVVHWSYRILYTFIGGNMVAGLFQAIITNGRAGVPTLAQLLQTYPAQLAQHQPYIFWPLVVGILALGIAGQFLDRHLSAVMEQANITKITAIADDEINIHVGPLRVAIDDLQKNMIPKGEGGDTTVYGPPFDLTTLTRSAHFVGRTADLQWLRERLGHTNDYPALAIRGIGGIGKTSLVAQVVADLRDRFPDGIAVVRCERQPTAPPQTTDDALAYLRAVIGAFDPRRKLPDATDPRHLADLAVARLQGKRALIVLDNIELELPLALLVNPLRVAGVQVLLTARQALPASLVAALDQHMLDVLAPAEALDLFAQWFGRADAGAFSAAERDAAGRIAAALGYHTYAVRLAASYAADGHPDLVALAHDLATDPQRALLIQGDDPSELLSLIFARSLRSLDDAGQRLFAGLGAFATSDLGRGAVLALGEPLALTPDAAEQSLTRLQRLALVDIKLEPTMTEGSDRERVRLHPLLRAFAHEQYERWKPDAQTTASNAVSSYYAEYANTAADAALVTDEANITAALEWAHDHHADEVVADLCSGMQYFWRDRGKTRASQRYLPWGVTAAEARLGPLPTADSADFASWQQRADTLFWLLYNQGYLAQMTGNLDAALQTFQRCQILADQAQSRWNAGGVLGTLGEIAQARGQLDVAQDYLQQALGINREVQDRRGEGVDLFILGQIAQDRGQLDVAQDYLQQALGIAREVQDWRGAGGVLGTLGQIAQARGQLDVAERYYRQGLAVVREVQNWPNVAVASGVLGEFLIRERGNRSEGCQMLTEAIRLYTEMGMTDEAEDVRRTAQELGCEG